MQESLLLVFEFEVHQETRPLDKVVPIVLSSALYDLTIILELMSLQNVASHIIFK